MATIEAEVSERLTNNAIKFDKNYCQDFSAPQWRCNLVLVVWGGLVPISVKYNVVNCTFVTAPAGIANRVMALSKYH